MIRLRRIGIIPLSDSSSPMAEQAQNAVTRFGVFEVNLRSGELRKHGLRLRVPGQPFKILAILLERPGEVVTREELKKSLWPDDTFVDFEHSLNSAIKKLRTVLGDSAENPRYIETIPRMGYRFVAPVDAGEPLVIAGSTPVPPEVSPQGKQGWRRALGFGVLVVVAMAVLFTWNHRKTRTLPFEITSTSRVSSDGLSIKAAISPDGRYIARTLSNSGLESLRVRLATTLHEIEIVPPAPVHYLGIIFSPNNEWVYYAVHSAVSEASVPVLYRVQVMGGPAQKLKEGLNSPVSLSPDGTKYAFMRESENESTLIIADVESGAERKLVSRKAPEFLDYPAWSPDGRTIACTAVDISVVTANGNDGRILEIRIRDGNTRVISRQHWGLIRQLAWAGDGRGLLMSTRGKEGIFHVWYVSYPDGLARKLTDGLNEEVGASISADSHQVVTVQERTLSGIWRMRPVHARDAETVVSGSSGTSPVVLMPDGRILFEKELNGNANIWVVDADGKGQKQLTLAGNNFSPSVCRSGRTLACLSDRNGVSAIWTMDTDGGNPVMVVKAAGDTTPQLSPDGTWIVYTATGSGPWRSLWKVGSRGGPAIELNDKLWRWTSISPDGKFIAGFYADHELNWQEEPTNIAVMGTEPGQPWKIISIPPSVSINAGIRWSPDGRELTYVVSGKDGDNVWSQPVKGGPPHQITQLHGYALFGFDWSQDGKELVFTRGIQARDVVLIQDTRQK